MRSGCDVVMCLYGQCEVHLARNHVLPPETSNVGGGTGDTGAVLSGGLTPNLPGEGKKNKGVCVYTI